MIVGDCPHCKNTFMISIGLTNHYSKQKCKSCKKIFWVFHSRLTPKAYTKRPDGIKKVRP